MKNLFRKINSIILITFMICLLPKLTVYASGAEIEPNNTLYNATPINVNSAYKGNLSNSDDVDCYKFTLTSNGNVTINFTHNQIAGDENTYWKVKLLNSSNTEYASFDVQGKTGQSYKKIGLPKGTYYLQVNSDYWMSYNVMNYYINIGFVSSTLYETEFNDSFDIADPIQINTKYTGRLDNEDDTDCYKFTLSSNGNVTINFTHNQIAGDEDTYWLVELLDSNNNEYVSFDSQGKTGLSYKKVGLPKGTYYLKVSCSYWMGYNAMDYNVNIGFISSNLYEKEFNDSLDTANSIQVNTKYTGRFDDRKYYDIDCYKFTLPASGNITVNFDHSAISGDDSTYWEISLLNANNDQYAAFDVLGYKQNTSKSVYLSGGTYYLKVEMPYWGSYNTMDYNIYITALAVPPILKASSAGYSSIKTNWSSIAGASGYEVYRASSSTGTYTKVTTTPYTSYTNTGLTTGVTYYYKVRAYKISGTSKVYGKFSLIVSAKPIPSAPVSVKAASASYNSIKLTWGLVSGASGYDIYRAASSTGTYSKITAATSTSFINTGLATGKAYYYKIRAYRTVGTTKIYSNYSAVVSAKPIPGAPTSVKAASSGYSSIRTSWSAVSGTSGYQIYRATSSTGTYALISTTITTSYNNTGLTTNRTYYYKIRAYRIVGTTKVYSNYSAVVSAKPIPGVPANFTAVRYSSTSIKLTWGGVSGASGYEIYRSTSSTGIYSLIKNTTSLYYINTGLTTGKTYYYKIRAYRMVGTTKVYSNWTVVKYAKP